MARSIIPLDEFRQRISSPVPTIKVEGHEGYDGTAEVEWIELRWDQWHQMSYRDLQGLLELVTSSIESEGLDVSSMKRTENGIFQEGYTIYKEFDPGWPHVRFRLRIEQRTLRTMLAMIYTSGWPLPSWEDLGPEMRDQVVGNSIVSSDREALKYAKEIMKVYQPEMKKRKDIEDALGPSSSDMMRTVQRALKRHNIEWRARDLGSLIKAVRKYLAAHSDTGHYPDTP